MERKLGDSLGISDRGTKAKTITTCDNAFVTNIVFGPRPCSEADVLCAKAKRQQQMFYLRESEAAATNVLSVRKRSGSNKCFICAKAKRQRQSVSQNGNQPHVLMMSH
ncbi:hypothetical protein [Lysinibacillus sp. NPDC059133]|uniref:hypothetical protein n=1 Tax=Lysinibacillus sp. NPDC059133 TaxID=3346737 RepID=UPI0036B35FAD